MNFKQTVRIQNLKGLHARATSVFVQTADRFQADIRVSKGDLTVSGKSIMGLMMLAAALGEDITIETIGADDAEAALNALIDLVNHKFNEDR